MTASELAEKIKSTGAVLHGPRIAVAREARVTQLKSGLFLPETAQARQSYGVVVMLGTELTLPIEIGDSVYIAVYGGVALEQPIGNEIYALEVLHAKDIFISWRKTYDPVLETGGQDDRNKSPRLERSARNQL